MSSWWTLKRKLGAGFAFLVLLTLAIALGSLLAFRSVVAGKDTVSYDHGQDLIKAAQLQYNAEQRVASSRAFFLTLREKFLDNVRQARAAFDTELADLRQHVASPEGMQCLEQVGLSERDLRAATDRLIEMRLAGVDLQEVLRYFEEELGPPRDRLGEALDAFQRHKKDLLDEARRDADNAAFLAEALLGGSGVVAVILGSILAFALPQSFTRLYESEKKASAESALRREEASEAEARVRLVLESTGEGIFGVDLECRCLFANPACCRLLGCKDERELIGKNMHALLHAAREDGSPCSEADCRIYRSLQQGKPLHGEDEIFWRADGTSFPVEYRAEPMIRGGEMVGGVVSFSDITLRKQQENALRNYNQDLEQFAYAASHDLQEPVHMVNLHAQLLQKNYGGRLDARADEIIGYTVEGASRLEALLDDLLAYLQAAKTSKEEEPPPVDSRAVLETVLLGLRPVLEKNQAVVTSGGLPVVRAQEVHLQQILQNLVGNALKYRREDPPRIHITAERKASEWLFCVKDNGMGMDPQYAKQVFGIFKRLHGTKYAGTGIGLALCSRILQAYGGRIWVESQPAEGSSFYFTLPA